MDCSQTTEGYNAYRGRRGTSSIPLFNVRRPDDGFINFGRPYENLGQPVQLYKLSYRHGNDRHVNITVVRKSVCIAPYRFQGIHLDST